jgi:hypothetical protein
MSKLFHRSAGTMTDTSRAFERAMTLAALSGLKIALGPAFLRTAQRSPSSRNWVTAALGEMFLDKVGVFPPRYRPSLLLPHAIAGAWVAHESLKEDGVEDPWAAAMGGVVAAGVSAVAPMVRITGHKVLGIPDALLGLAEDYFALKLGSQAMGLSMEQVTEAARETVGDVGERLKPALQSVGVGGY